MKLVRIRYENQARWAAIESETQCCLLESQSDPAAAEESGQDRFALSRLPWLSSQGRSDQGPKLALQDVEFLPPVQGMEKVICIGTNYAEHAREMGGEPPKIPVVFNKFPSAIIAHLDKVVHPSICTKLDFEAELVVVIGKEGRHIPREVAMEHVFGYCCGNDVTSRDWQKEKPGGQWLLGKTFDTFAPLGPMLVTRDDVPDPHRLNIQFRLNGQVMQNSNTDQLIFSIDYLIAHLSQFVTLRPGDLIFTGTPPGVGAGRTPPHFLRPGDEMEVEIEGLGVLRNQVVAARC